MKTTKPVVTAGLLVFAALSLGVLLGLLLALSVNPTRDDLLALQTEIETLETALKEAEKQLTRQIDISAAGASRNATLQSQLEALQGLHEGLIAKHAADGMRHILLLDKQTELLAESEARAGRAESQVEKLRERLKPPQQENEEPAKGDLADLSDREILVRMANEPKKPKANSVPVRDKFTSEIDGLSPTLLVRIIDRTGSYQEHSWQLELKNYYSQSVTPTVELRWVDRDGFVLDTTYPTITREIAGGETVHFAGTTLIDNEKAVRVVEVTIDISR